MIRTRSKSNRGGQRAVSALVCLWLVACGQSADEQPVGSRLDAPLYQLLDATDQPTPISVQFGEQNVLAGFDGCAPYAGSYHRSGGNLYVTALSSKSTACADEGARAQQAVFLDALQHAIAIDERDDRIDITSERSDVPLRFLRSTVTR